MEEYIFDACGFVKIKGLIQSTTVNDLKSLLEDYWQDTRSPGFRRVRDLEKVSSYFRELAENLAVQLRIDRFINQPYRLIESYALHRSGGSMHDLHNGFCQHQQMPWGDVATRTMWRHHTFHDGKTYAMMVKVLVYLSDILLPEQGPFCWLEGSHKSNFKFPLSGTEIKSGMANGTLPCLHSVGVSAGDVIVLNEALTHGALEKRSSEPRIVVAFSYAPRFVSDYREVDIGQQSVFEGPAFYT